MTELEKGPRGLRRGRGARERILSASQQLFRDQGINGTGMDQLCAVAEVSKRTLYQHFTGTDELLAECLRRFDPDILPEVFDRTDLTPSERLLAAFDVHAPLCPFIAAAADIADPRPAPPTPNGAASNWLSCRTPPRPAAESSTPKRSPPPPPSQPSSSTTPSPRQRHRPAQALSSSTARMTMTPAGAAPHVPAVAPLPSTLARATSLTASRSRCDRKASLSRIARGKIAASPRAGAPAMMRHGTDEACVPGHRAMDGHVIERVAGARPGRMLS